MRDKLRHPRPRRYFNISKVLAVDEFQNIEEDKLGIMNSPFQHQFEEKNEKAWRKNHIRIVQIILTGICLILCGAMTIPLVLDHKESVPSWNTSILVSLGIFIVILGVIWRIVLPNCITNN